VRLALTMRVRSQGRNSRVRPGMGVFEAREDGGCGGAVAADEDDVCVAFGVPGECLCDALANRGAADENANGCVGRVPGRV
jgi:hypothetical protein